MKCKIKRNNKYFLYKNFQVPQSVFVLLLPYATCFDTRHKKRRLLHLILNMKEESISIPVLKAE